MHADTDFVPGPGLLHTTFVALQPVTRALGPTRFLPGTHAARAPHAALEAMGDVTGLRRTRDAPPPPSLVALLSTGDASLYDGKILHCGGANSWRQPSWRDASRGRQRGSTTYVSERRPHLPGRQPSLLAAANRGRRRRRVCRRKAPSYILAPSVASQPASGDGMRVLLCSVLNVPSRWRQRAGCPGSLGRTALGLLYSTHSREAPRPLGHRWQHAALPSTGAKAAHFPSANTTLRFYMTFRHAAHPEAFDPARSILAKYDGRVHLGMLRDLRQPDHA